MKGGRFRIVTRDELVVLLNAGTWRSHDPAHEALSYRHAAVVALVSLCGVRPVELRGLDVGDWRPDGRNVLFIRGTSKRPDREIPLLETASLVVERYLQRHPAGDDPRAALLATGRGGRLQGKLAHAHHRVVGRRVGLGSSLLAILRGSFEAWVRSAEANDGSEEMLLGHPLRLGGTGAPPSEERLRSVLARVHPLSTPDRGIWKGSGLARPRLPPRATKFDGQEEYLARLLGAEPDLTLIEIRHRLLADTGVSVSPTPIAKHLRRHALGRWGEPGALRRPRRGGKRKLDGLEDYLAKLLEAEPDLILREICRRLSVEHGVSVTIQTVASELRRHAIDRVAGGTKGRAGRA